jgi:hypothetical protein
MAIALHPVEAHHLQAVLAGKLILPLEHARRLAQLRDFFQRLGEVGAVHHGDVRHVVAEARGVGVLPQVRTLADLLDDVFFLAQLRAVEDLDLQPALGALLDALAPADESLVVRLLRPEHVVELEREGLGCLRLDVRQGQCREHAQDGDESAHCVVRIHLLSPVADFRDRLMLF